MARVFIVDDHELVREGLKTVLGSQPSLTVVGEAGSFSEMSNKLSRTKADVIILDISLPDKSGLEILKYLKQHFRRLRVLILSMHPEERFAVRALKAGASGYVNKQMASKELVKAIDKITSGGRYISPAFAERIASELDSTLEGSPHEGLTDREYEIMRFIAVGMTASQIADKLSLSINTVTTYRARVLKKMNVKTSADIIRYALEHHLID